MTDEERKALLENESFWKWLTVALLVVLVVVVLGLLLRPVVLLTALQTMLKATPTADKFLEAYERCLAAGLSPVCQNFPLEAP